MSKFFLATPRGLEQLLVEEIGELGVKEVKQTVSGVWLNGQPADAYRILMWSRLATRILVPVSEFRVTDENELYDRVRDVDWSLHFDVGQTFVVDVNLVQARLPHSQYAGLKVKDAIVDQFRDKTGTRPSVDRQEPDLRINLFVKRDQASLSIDLGGGSLHRRGLRGPSGAAPMKEHLAAAILWRCGWPVMARERAVLIDPMCGSATLLIEGAMMAADIAPGLYRPYPKPEGWKQFDRGLWHQLKEEARERQAVGCPSTRGRIFGFDRDDRLVRAVEQQLAKTVIGDLVNVSHRALGDWKPRHEFVRRNGLVLCNPPYGERMGAIAEVVGLYAQLGAMLKRCFNGYEAAVFTGRPTLGKLMGVRADKRYRLMNGDIPCELLRFHLDPSRYVNREATDQMMVAGTEVGLEPSAAMFRNRLKKNKKRLEPWAKKNGIGCYRVYDADMPEYNVAIDRYRDHLVVQEYRAPQEIPEEVAMRRLMDVLLVAPDLLAVERRNVSLKVRKKMKGSEQYQKAASSGETMIVHEGGLKFKVNLWDYLDTGLFLDHRPIRRRIREMAAGRSFLNLFSYTGSASVFAAAGGARSTLSVDLSTNYTRWAEDNLTLNGFTGRNHRCVAAECQRWLRTHRERFDLIFVDPPSFSNSKKMQGVFDVQEDHVNMLKGVSRCMVPDAILIFSNNRRGFKMDWSRLSSAGLQGTEITAETMDPDFEKSGRIHHCYLLQLTS